MRQKLSGLRPALTLISPPTDDSAACLADVEDPKTARIGLLRPAPSDTQTGRGVQSSHLPQAVASAPGVKKRHPLQVLLGSGDVSV